MKWYATLFTGLCFTLSATAQQVALDFDGGNDEVQIANASSRIAGTNISMTFWVYPTNPAPNYPNFDGMAGFRNDFSADFYVLHLSATTVEARFRNSSGTNYDITGTAAVNQWQHYALTYDGSTLKLYRNGTINGIVAATGNIASSVETMFIGKIPYSSADFFLDGKVDDVTLWNKALSAAEVSCIYNYGVDTNSTGLQLYYSCDQNVPGGNNSGKTTLTDVMGNINGTLTNFTLSGNSSNWVAGYGSHTYINGNICAGDSMLFNGNYVKTPGAHLTSYSLTSGCDSVVSLNLIVHNSDSITKNYHLCYGDSIDFGGTYLKDEGTFTQTFTSKYGCDSTATAIIDVDTVQTGITNNQGTLLSLAFTGTYQWFNCDVDSIIPGETMQSYAFPVHGNYAVIVTQNGCTDTSDCLYTALGIEQFGQSPVRISPNPTNGKVTLELPSHDGKYNVKLHSYSGQLTRVWNDLETGTQTLDLSGIKPGIYLVDITAAGYHYSEKLVCQ